MKQLLPLLMNMSKTFLYEFLAMLKQLSLSLLASFRLANITPPYSNRPSSMLPLCASSLFLYRQTRGFLASNPSHKSSTLSSMRRGILSCLIGAGFLVLTACAGGEGESGSSGSGGGNGGGGVPRSLLEVDLTFAPIANGFVISNQSDFLEFGNFTSLNITATSGDELVWEVVPITAFSDGNHSFTGLDDALDWKFEITGILSDGGEQEVKIVFIWEENEADHRSGGIRPGANRDGDGRADSVDEDIDGDGIDNEGDDCSTGETSWMSNSSTDNDGDGCRDDSSEDTDDDNDGLGDSSDDCSTGETSWMSNSSTDNDGDGCRDDSSEDTDDDNDGLGDSSDDCPTGETSWMSNSSTDNDGDGCQDDGNEDTDDDNDGVGDSLDDCPTGETSWTSNSSSDNDGDGCQDDSNEDTDDDNDGLADDDAREVQTNSNNVSCSLLVDCDGDTIRDEDEVTANCVIKPDCDNDGTQDDTDIDIDGNGLIEIANATELDSVRYALNGNGRRLSASAPLNTGGCGRIGGLRVCHGYELVANISLAAYTDADSGKGWQPLGSCDGSPFGGTFEGNDFMISGLSISRSNEDCVGLFGHIAANSEIRNLKLRAERVVGNDFVGSLVGNGDAATISSSFVLVGNVSGNANVGGLVGRGHSAAIVNSFVAVDEVSGTGNNIGGLVGSGLSSRIHSSSVMVAEVSGNTAVGGLVGFLNHGARPDPAVVARIYSSSVVAAEVHGSSLVGGLGGDTRNIWIHTSSVVVGEVRGTRDLIGGLVGGGPGTKVFSSSVVAGLISAGQDDRGNSKLGGMMGGGPEAEIFSSSVVVGEVSGTGRNVGGLVGNANKARFYSSSVVVGNLSGSGMNLGGLVGEFAGSNPGAKVAYSYVVSGSNTDMLVGVSNMDTAAVASYWDSLTSGVGSSRLGIGSGRSTSALQMPTSYDEGGIYADWDNHTDIFSDGMTDEPLAVWCDKDNSGIIEEGEDTDDNRVWDFGTSSEYPAIDCAPIAPAEWRSWWSLDGSGNPVLNRTRLARLLTFVEEGDSDNDGINDHSDQCPTGLTGWLSGAFTDNDGDGCRDTVEDTDDDNDGVNDNSDQCPTGATDWTSDSFNDVDGDGCRDADEDIDLDGDRLIEIANAAELDSVRYALNGNGRRLSASAPLNTGGCGRIGGLRVCHGYELVANISLAAYAGKGWQPLGSCDGSPFGGIFEGNDFMISGLSISRSNENCVGLFGHIAANSEIRNLRLSAERVVGNDFVGSLVGNGDAATISSSSVLMGNVSGNANVGGLVGRGHDARIIASLIEAAEVSGNNRIGGLMGDGQNARINDSSVVAAEVSGNDNVGGMVGDGRDAQIIASSIVVDEVSGNHLKIGGMVGDGQGARIIASSVVAAKVSGTSSADTAAVGGLVGWSRDKKVEIHFSSVVAGEVHGAGEFIGGLVGNGGEAEIFSSSVVADLISTSQAYRNRKIGGLMGDSQNAVIFSSLVVVGNLSGAGTRIGGLVGNANGAKIYSSSVVVGNLSLSGTGTLDIGGLVGEFKRGKVAYSYVVSGSDTDMLVGDGDFRTEAVASYWDSLTSGVGSSRLSIGSGRSTSALQMPISYDEGGIYADWDTETNIFSDGEDEPLAVWCDKDNSGSITAGERVIDNLIWDFGTSSEYPAIDCAPIAPAEWRSWWSLDGSGSPVLNRTRLARLLTFVEEGDSDNDGINDHSDQCPTGLTGWLSGAFTDNDGDGCRDTVEDTDDDNDGVNDNSDQCPTGATDWTSDSFNDVDGDGCRDADEDIDLDGDRLIEIANAAELDSVRYALNGNGRRLSASAPLNTGGCGRIGGLRVCHGYELVANISLAAYTDADSGKGWQPLGSCDGSPFGGIFEGNDFVISGLSISRPNEDCVGLFGHIAADSEIRNLRLSAERVVGDDFVGSLVGNGDAATISYSSVLMGNVSGNANVGGLVGRGHSATIVNSFVAVDEVSGTGNNIGGLVGSGLSSRIHSSSVMVAEVSGNTAVGGLVGYLNHGTRPDPAIVARIYSSSVAAAEVHGNSLVGGLGGDTRNIWIHSSSVVAAEVRGTRDLIGGLVGGGPGTKVFSSSVVVGLIAAGQDSNGNSKLGGMMGGGPEAEIYSSSVVVDEVSGTGRNIGGLVGNANKAKFYSSSVVVGSLSGSGMNLGGLVGEFAGKDPGAKVAYSYVVSGSNTDMLVGVSNMDTAAAASYWDSLTSGVGSSRLGIGSGRSTSALQMPTSYDEGGIYADWDTETDIFGDGMTDEPLAVWCDKDNSGIIEEGEDTDDNRVWDFGTSSEYPAIDCTPIAPAEWRSWWSLDGSGGPALNRTRLARLLTFVEDGDSDNDGVNDNSDQCPTGVTGWLSGAFTDNDGDGCRDTVEDTDDDNDGVNDNSDQCPIGATGWTSDSFNDADGDGCRDVDEEIDADGDGLIEIATAAQLDAVRHQLDGRGPSCSSCNGYELVRDISLAAYADADSGKGWQPLGSCDDSPFAGTFEGNDFMISGLSISRPTEDCVGLFGHIAADSEIRNLRLRAERVVGNDFVGSLVGRGHSAAIVNAFAVADEVNGAGENVGGLMGDGDDATISSSSVVVENVSGNANVAGLVGDGRRSEIVNSLVEAGEVSGTSNNVGGLVGFGDGAQIDFSSVVVGNVNGDNDVGGLVGDGKNNDIANSSVEATEVSGTGNNVGGLVGYGEYAQIDFSSAMVGNVNGDGENVGGLMGDGDDAAISSSSAVVGNVSGSANVAGLVGDGRDSEIVNSSVEAAEVSGTSNNVGGLVGFGGGAQIDFSSVVVGNVNGNNDVGGLVGDGQNTAIVNSSVVVSNMNGVEKIGGLVGNGDDATIGSSSAVVGNVRGSANVAGLVGWGEDARIVNSSVKAAEVRGTSNNVGGLVGFGRQAWIGFSSVMIGDVDGDDDVGGLVGDSQNTAIVNSLVVVNTVHGRDNVGGLLGSGNLANISSSSVVAGRVIGGSTIGGLAGDGQNAQIISSSVVAGDVRGGGSVGGLVGNFNFGKVAYSYVVSGSNTNMLAGDGDGTGVASYWDRETSRISNGNFGAPKTTRDLRNPTDYAAIYTSWDDETNIFDDGDVPLAVWCDKDHSGSIEADEEDDANRIWDFGTSSEYPAIRCTPITPGDWRDWWSLVGGKPVLDRARLDSLLPSLTDH